MSDLFKILHIETKEDKYTFCLKEMLESNREFRKNVGKWFGFNEPFEIARNTFSIDYVDDRKRKQITPDLVLFCDSRIAVIESKMFSQEGYKQTADYESGKEIIKKELSKYNADVCFYFLTLSGVSAESPSFITVKWVDFYLSCLDGIVFDDATLEVIKNTILSQAHRYKDFEKALKDKPYNALFDDEAYWITPMTMFASGVYDSFWLPEDGTGYDIWNGPITGQGHSEFVTNINCNSKWRIKGNKEYGIHLFVRIEWDLSPVVWLSWEYYQKEDSYSPISGIAPPYHDIAVSNLINYKNAFWSKNTNGKMISSSVVCPSKKDKNSIKALKCIVSGDGKIDEVLNETKRIVTFYISEIERIKRAIICADDHLEFSGNEYGNGVF